MFVWKTGNLPVLFAGLISLCLIPGGAGRKRDPRSTPFPTYDSKMNNQLRIVIEIDFYDRKD